jgi:type IV secretion system protein VirB2
MEPKLYDPNAATHTKNMLTGMIMTFVAMAVMLAPSIALALPTGTDFNPTGQKVCGFFDSIHNILNMASLAVVTVAVIFSGYQIAFAHKRIGDVAPVLIGGVLIGAAGQVAQMVIGDTGQSCPSGGSATGMILHLLQNYA